MRVVSCRGVKVIDVDDGGWLLGVGEGDGGSASASGFGSADDVDECCGSLMPLPAKAAIIGDVDGGDEDDVVSPDAFSRCLFNLTSVSRTAVVKEDSELGPAPAVFVVCCWEEEDSF